MCILKDVSYANVLEICRMTSTEFTIDMSTRKKSPVGNWDNVTETWLTDS